MSAERKIFVNCIKNVMAVKHMLLANKECLRDHRIEGINMA